MVDMVDSEQIYDSIFLSYGKILKRFEQEHITKKNGTKITDMDLRFAVIYMLKKHPSCRWRSERKKNKRYYILIEGYSWLKNVFFQKEKTIIDADVDFFKIRIHKYEELLKLEAKNRFCMEDMTVKELERYFEKVNSSVRYAIKKMCESGYSNYKFYKDRKVVISALGVEWLCQNIFKQKYLKLLEEYKMELTEKYIAAGYPYDIFFGKN